MNDLQLLNQTLATLTAQIAAWYPQILILATDLLAAVAFLQLGLVMFSAATSRNLHTMIHHLGLGFFRIGLVYAVMANTDVWGNALIDGAAQFAQQVSGQSPEVITPSGIFNVGLNTAGIILTAKGHGSWLHPVQDIEFFFTEIVVVLAWAMIALFYLGTLLKAAWTVYTGPIYIAFSAFDATFPMLLRWFQQVLALGLRLILLVLLLAVGLGIAQTWAAQLAANATAITTDLWYLILSVVQAIVFLYMVKTVPDEAANIVGTQISTFGEAFAERAPAATSSAASAMAGAVGQGAKKAGQSFSDAAHHKSLYAMK